MDRVYFNDTTGSGSLIFVGPCEPGMKSAAAEVTKNANEAMSEIFISDDPDIYFSADCLWNLATAAIAA